MFLKDKSNIYFSKNKTKKWVKINKKNSKKD